jgi:hypothetical protein
MQANKVTEGAPELVLVEPTASTLRALTENEAAKRYPCWCDPDKTATQALTQACCPESPWFVCDSCAAAAVKNKAKPI